MCVIAYQGSSSTTVENHIFMQLPAGLCKFSFSIFEHYFHCKYSCLMQCHVVVTVISFILLLVSEDNGLLAQKRIKPKPRLCFEARA